MPSRIPIGWLINPPRNQEERSKEREVAEKGKSKKSDAHKEAQCALAFYCCGKYLKKNSFMEVEPILLSIFKVSLCVAFHLRRGKQPNDGSLSTSKQLYSDQNAQQAEED